jgi:hypothetical protein
VKSHKDIVHLALCRFAFLRGEVFLSHLNAGVTKPVLNCADVPPCTQMPSGEYVPQPMQFEFAPFHARPLGGVLASAALSFAASPLSSGTVRNFPLFTRKPVFVKITSPSGSGKIPATLPSAAECLAVKAQVSAIVKPNGRNRILCRKVVTTFGHNFRPRGRINNANNEDKLDANFY